MSIETEREYRKMLEILKMPPEQWRGNEHETAKRYAAYKDAAALIEILMADSIQDFLGLPV